MMFVCSTGRLTGLGHLSRSMNLAAELVARGATCSFFLDASDPIPPGIVEGRVAEVEWVGDGIGAAINALRQAVTMAQPEWVVLDSYHARESDIERLAAMAPLAVIDDLADRDLNGASLVVNATPGSDTWSYRAGSAEILAGASYALVHETFRSRRKTSLERRTWHERVQRIALSLGGTDATGAIEWVLDEIRNLTDAEVRVAGIARGEEVARADFLGFLEPDDLADLMEWADLFIATPSTLAWELATLGVPSLFLRTADNQLRIAEHLDSLEGVSVVESAAGFADRLAPLLELSVERRVAAESLRRVCDGRGCERVAARMVL